MPGGPVSADWGPVEDVPVFGESYVEQLARDLGMSTAGVREGMQAAINAGAATRSPEGVVTLMWPDGSLYVTFDDVRGCVLRGPHEPGEVRP